MDPAPLIKKIQAIRKSMGRELVILTHHYQHPEIVALGDYAGDSFGLARKAATDHEARHIIFCGVHFMAESAAILARPGQTVQIPDPDAGCWMADMADAHIAQQAWETVTALVDKTAVMPLVYMNSDAAVKALCGRHGGAVCTSSNAGDAFAWALARREKVFFFPDEHLGRNTAEKMGIGPDHVIVWDPEKPLGGNTEQRIKEAAVILWKGYCLVHTRFTVAHIQEKRRAFPGALVVTHPECTREVVRASDAVGSTGFIVKFTQQAPRGSTVV
ncbi:MAG: quinolinate synthase NadA, partial [Thermodesulfobacteriota bacterium]